MVIKFRIQEFIQAPEGSPNRFFIQKGTIYWEKIWLFIWWRKTKWEDIQARNSSALLGTQTFNEAVAMVQELKKQIPTYHEVK